MNQYKKILAFHHSHDFSSVRCFVDLSPTGILTLPDQTAIQHQVLFSQYLIPELSTKNITKFDLILAVPTYHEIVSNSLPVHVYKSHLQSVFAAVSTLLEIEVLNIQIFHFGDGRNDTSNKKRRLNPRIDHLPISLGNLILPSLVQLKLNFQNTFGCAFSFQTVHAPDLDTFQTNFGICCLSQNCKLFENTINDVRNSRCFTNYLDSDQEQYLIQGVLFSKHRVGSHGLLYELEEENNRRGGQFSISTDHFPQFLNCYHLKRITVLCGDVPVTKQIGKVNIGWS
jgi:hypothetical protein